MKKSYKGLLVLVVCFVAVFSFKMSFGQVGGNSKEYTGEIVSVLEDSEGFTILKVAPTTVDYNGSNELEKTITLYYDSGTVSFWTTEDLFDEYENRELIHSEIKEGAIVIFSVDYDPNIVQYNIHRLGVVK